MERCRYCEKPLAYCRCGREAYIKLITDGMMDEADQRKDELDPGDTDLEWLFEKHINLTGLNSKWAYDDLSNDPKVVQCMNEIADMIQGHHADKMLYLESPMKYYGLKENDFL